MATAPTLARAANQADDNLFPFFVANTLKGKLNTFARACLDVLPDAQDGTRPVAHWMTMLLSVAHLMPASSVPLAQYERAMQMVYRGCLMAQQLQTQGALSSAAATAILASYNAQF
jgi:hypothetical protein